MTSYVCAGAMQVMKKKAKPGKGGKAPSKTLTKIEPVASFFNFFSPPQVCATISTQHVCAPSTCMHGLINCSGSKELSSPPMMLLA